MYVKAVRNKSFERVYLNLGIAFRLKFIAVVNSLEKNGIKACEMMQLWIRRSAIAVMSDVALLKNTKTKSKISDMLKG